MKGIGQIMLQEKASTGLFFLAGIFLGSVEMGVAAIAASCCGTLTALIFKFDQSAISKGLYGFGPALVGVALMLFFKPSFTLWLFVVIGSFAAALLQHWFIRKKIPVFTLPFVLVTWLMIYVTGKLILLTPVVPDSLAPDVFDYSFAFRGYGQVIFQDSIAAGILFFAGVFVCSPVAALYGFFGSLFAGLLAILFGMPETEVVHGLYSFNAVLCAIVFAGWKLENIIWALLSIIIAVLISMAMNHFKMIQLTFPFVVAAFLCTLMKDYADKRFFRIIPN